jgi:hypothetical protein
MFRVNVKSLIFFGDNLFVCCKQEKQIGLSITGKQNSVLTTAKETINSRK